MRRFSRRLLVASVVVAFSSLVGVQLLAIFRQQPADDSLRDSQPAALNPRSDASLATPAPSDASATLTSGDQIARQALAALDRRPNIAAKVRQTLLIDGEPITGAGEYWQRGVLNQRSTCWQLQTAAGGQSTLFRQVFERGRFLWTDRRRGDQRTVTRIDAWRIARELHASDDSASQLEIQNSAPADVNPQLRVRGGMTQLMADLVRAFRFDPYKPARYGDKPVMAIVGRWREDVLAEEWPNARIAGKWPAHLPHHVLIQIGVDDLFPYLVEYRAADDGYLADSAAAHLPTPDPLARYEFYDVQFAALMPEKLFEFPSADVEWTDVTAATIARLNPPPPSPSTPF